MLAYFNTLDTHERMITKILPLQAAAQQPPSIHQYKAIQQRVENMERNHKNQISELQDTIQKLEKEKVCFYHGYLTQSIYVSRLYQ